MNYFKKNQIFFQNLNAKQQVASGGRAYDLNFPKFSETSSDNFYFNQRSKFSQTSDDVSFNRWRERSKPPQHQDQNQYLLRKIRTEKRDFVSRRRRKRGSERIRAPPLPQQQQHPEEDAKYEESVWQTRSENRQLSYPRECQNFNFGPLADFGKERGDNFMRFTTVSWRKMFLFFYFILYAFFWHFATI